MKPLDDGAVGKDSLSIHLLSSKDLQVGPQVEDFLIFSTRTNVSKPSVVQNFI